MFLKIKNGFFKIEKLCSWIMYIFIGAKGGLRFLLYSLLHLFMPTRSRDSFPPEAKHSPGLGLLR